MADELKSVSGIVSEAASGMESAGDALAAAAAGPPQPVTRTKWYQWRKQGTALIAYLLDSEVHTFAFSVAANAIISFHSLRGAALHAGAFGLPFGSHEGAWSTRW